MSGTGRVAIVYGSPPGIGGLGHSVSVGITAVANGSRETFALGPGRTSRSWSLPGETPRAEWLESPEAIQPWMVGYTWLRWRPGKVTSLRDFAVARWAGAELERLRPDSCYLFTQVALESLRWCRREGIPTALENPNGHIRNFAEVCERESRRWFGKKFMGHPTPEMVERVEEEYRLADRIRVYSEWAKASMVRLGVPEHRVHVLPPAVNLDRFCPAAARPSAEGPLRVCHAGSLDLRKGFAYLLKAIRAVGSKRIQLRMVGATGDRDCAQLLARESAGLDVQVAPGDPLPVYRDSELLVVPTLEDGFNYVVAEGLACGLPVIVSREAGASECVRPGVTGWVTPAADAGALAAALEDALARRTELYDMGRMARADVERCAGPDQVRQLSDWFYRDAAVHSFPGKA